MNASGPKILPLVLSVGLLAGLAVEGRLRPKPADAAPFHERARQQAEQMPLEIGNWHGQEHPPEPAATRLLRPNVIRQISFVNEVTGRSASLLLVQCHNARDMIGHYPPNCYGGQGWTEEQRRPMLLQLSQTSLPGREYRFYRVRGGQRETQYIWNVLILPSGRLVDDMSEVEEAAADYQRYFYGAAQLQVVVSGNLEEPERREIYRELIEANWPMLKVLSSGGSR